MRLEHVAERDEWWEAMKREGDAQVFGDDLDAFLDSCLSGEEEEDAVHGDDDEMDPALLEQNFQDNDRPFAC